MPRLAGDPLVTAVWLAFASLFGGAGWRASGVADDHRAGNRRGD
jgi:hypothetical protein